jgi:gamma-glutamyltranspeptidase/glutathione hydrolase
LASLLIAGIAGSLEGRRSEDAAYHHLIIEATKRALTLRNRLIADPREVDEDLADFLSEGFLRHEAALVDRSRAAVSPRPRTEGDAAWIGCIDANGLAVSYAQSVHGPFGSGCVLPRTGVLWHNRGLDFSLDPASRNALAPGRKPFHSLNPALAAFADNRVLAYGGSTLEAQAQVLFHYAALGRSLGQAVEAPRWKLGAGERPNESVVRIEDGFDTGLMRGLARLGHPVEAIGPSEADAVGCAGMIVKHPRNNRVEAAHDPRGDGDVMGL